jgi:hypothetical protein
VGKDVFTPHLVVRLAMIPLAFPLIFLIAGECEFYLATIRTRKLYRL